MYPVFDVSESLSQRPETLGTKEKFWVIPSSDVGLPAVPHLFKIGRPGTGENWAEKVCYEILRVIGIPCATYHFAVFNGAHGVLSERMMQERASLFTADLLFASVVDGYDGTLAFRQIEYRLSRAFGILRRIQNLHLPTGCPTDFPSMTPEDLFLGYLVFDALVGNTDRHHGNWGIIVQPGSAPTERPTLCLAPTFDHASSLGRNESDERRAARLQTKDSRQTVEAYAARARSAFFEKGRGNHPLNNREILQELVLFNPSATRYWASKIVAIPISTYDQIFDNIDRSLISGISVDFARRVLLHNRNMIEEVCL